MNLFVSLSENDKRLIFAILIIFVLVFVVIGYIGYLITRVMKWQGKKLDTLVADPVITKVITNKKHFIRYARKKNWRLFLKQSYIAVLILIVAGAVLLIRDAIYHDFSYNPFNKETGFGSILFLWDFSVCFKFENSSLVLNWPTLINTPHLVADAWGGYAFTIFLIVGGLWYLIALQSLIARTIRMYSLSTSAFEKTLEGFNQNQHYVQQNYQQPQQQSIPPAENNINNNNNQ